MGRKRTLGALQTTFPASQEAPPALHAGAPGWDKKDPRGLLPVGPQGASHKRPLGSSFAGRRRSDVSDAGFPPSDERGQATAEYAILAFMTVALFMIVFEQVWTGILDHYQDLSSFLALPIP